MASGLADFLGTGNPFQQWVSGNRGRLGAFGAGLASGTDFATGLSNAAQNLPRGAAVDDAYAQMQEEKAQQAQTLNQTTEWLRNNGHANLLAAVESGAMTPGQAWQIALEPPPAGPGPTANMQNYEFLLAQGIDPQQALSQVFGGAGGNQTVSTQPQYFEDPETGQVRLGQLSSTGQVVWSDTNGLTPLTPGDLSQQRAYGTAAGRGLFEGEQALGGAQITADTANNSIERLRNNQQGQAEQFGNIFGIPQQWLPVLPGSARANFQVDLEQAQGQAFIQAREFLKGQGQITDFESRRAEAAFSRLEAAARIGDQAGFNEALNDFQTAVNDGLAKVQRRAGQGQGQSPTGTTSGGVTWSLE